MQNYIIKNASIQDINLMLEWARLEGWNPGLYDAVPFYVTDPTGFFIGYLNKTPIASISVVRYPNHFGFLGFYIVMPEYRGHGYGFRLWQKGLEYLKDYNVGLDGVITQQENYRKSGFTLAHRNIRYGGKILKTKHNPHLINAHELPFNLIQEYDQRFFPSHRSAFLAAWLGMPQSHALAILEDETMMGFGVIRKCYEGYKIGPLFAENIEIAEQLLQGLANTVQSHSIPVGPQTAKLGAECTRDLNDFALEKPKEYSLYFEAFPMQNHLKVDVQSDALVRSLKSDRYIFIDIPEVNQKALQLVKQFNLTPVFETARMYTQFSPPIHLTKIFGVTTFELG